MAHQIGTIGRQIIDIVVKGEVPSTVFRSLQCEARTHFAPERTGYEAYWAKPNSSSTVGKKLIRCGKSMRNSGGRISRVELLTKIGRNATVTEMWGIIAPPYPPIIVNQYVDDRVSRRRNRIAWVRFCDALVFVSDAIAVCVFCPVHMEQFERLG